MRRRLFNLFCATSALLFVVGIGLWVRSYFMSESISHESWRANPTGQSVVMQRGMYGIEWSCGALHVWRIQHVIPNGRAEDDRWFYDRQEPVVFAWAPKSQWDRLNLRFGGFKLALLQTQLDYPHYEQHLVLPLWLSLLGAVPPAVWWHRRRRRGRTGFPVTVNAGPLDGGSPAHRGVRV